MSEEGERKGTERRTFLQALGVFGSLAAAGEVTATRLGRTPSGDRNELIVGATDGASVASAESNAMSTASADMQVTHRNEQLGYFTVERSGEVGTQSTDQLKRELEGRSDVAYVEENSIYETMEAPNDPRFDTQYAPQQVNVSPAWDETMGTEDVTLAIVDTGAAYDHPDLQDQFGSDVGDDFVDFDDDPYPDDTSTETHGTHVSGCASASTDNGLGVAGVSNSRLLNVRVLNEEGNGWTTDIADAVQWAADEGADIINMSLGGDIFQQTMKDAVSYAADKDVLLVCAAGNAGRSPVSYPARYEECVAVTALNPDESFWSSSNWGSDAEVAAPGVNVLSTIPGDDYAEYSGTSMASPIAAGVAALGKAADPDLSASELRQRLKDTAVDIGLSETAQGAGRVDAANIVDAGGGGGGGGGGGDDGEPPTATIGTVDEDLEDWIRLDARDSSDPDGGSLSYQWEISSGEFYRDSSDTAEQPWIDISNTDGLTATLTVTDDEGQTDTAERTFDFGGGGGGGGNESPTADAAAGTTDPTVGQSVSFDGSGSSDPDGSITSYEWDFGDGDSATGSQVSHTYDAEGEYTATLTVTDDAGASATDSVSLSVGSGSGDGISEGTYKLVNVNSGMVLDIEGTATHNGASCLQSNWADVAWQKWEVEEFDNGEYRIVNEHSGNVVDVEGVSTQDGADIHQWEWLNNDNQKWRIESVGDGVHRVRAVHSGKDLSVENRSTETGANVLQLDWADDDSQYWRFEAVDGGGGGGNEAPTASASADTTDPTVGQAVSFDGSDSSDPDGSISSYEWEFGDGDSATGSQVNHTYDAEGEYSATLTVTDDAGATATDSVSLSVQPDSGEAPTATIGTVDENLDDWVRLDASGSSDPDGGSLSYQWEISSGEFYRDSSDTAEQPWIDISNTDGLTATLTVTDDEGQTDTAERTFDFGGGGGGGNESPTADASAGTTEPTVGQSVSFDGSGSNDPDGTISSYEWEFGDGDSATDSQVSHTYDAEGEYTATLTVTDDAGATATDSVSLSVQPDSGGAPTASIGTVEEDYENWIRLDASGSSDPDGGSLSYQWEITSGQFWTGNSDTAEQPWIDISNTDGLTATLTVTDDEGKTDTAERTFDFGGGGGGGGNESPTASASAGTTNPTVGQSVSFDGSGSSDPDGSISSYEWEFGDGASATGSQVSHTYDAEGEYTATLTVTDDAGATATDSVTLSVGSGSGDGISEGTYRLVNVNSGKVLDIEGTSTSRGASCLQANWADVAWQKWEVQELSDGEYRIFNKHSDLNISVESRSTDDGADIHQWTWSDRDAQKWRIEDVGGGEYKIEAVHSGKVLDVSNASQDALANVHQWRWTGGDNQRWRFEAVDGSSASSNESPTASVSAGTTEPTVGQSVSFDGSGSSDPDGSISSYEWAFGDGGTATGAEVSHTYDAAGEYTATLTVTDEDGATATDSVTLSVQSDGGAISDGTYRLVNVNSGKVLDVSQVSRENGATLHQWEYGGGANQHWQIEDLGGGEYRLTAQHSGKVADVEGVSRSNGADVHQWNWWGGSNQKWKIESVGGGEYRVESVHSGKVLEVAGGSTRNGGNVQQWNWHGGANQRWRLVEV